VSGAGDLLARLAGPGAGNAAGLGESNALRRAPTAPADATPERFERELADVARREREKRPVAAQGLDVAAKMSFGGISAPADPARERGGVGWGSDPDSRAADDRADRVERNRDARDARDAARAEETHGAREPGRTDESDERNAPEADRGAERPSSARESSESDDAARPGELHRRQDAAESAQDAAPAPEGADTAPLTDGATESPDAAADAIAAAVSSGARDAASNGAKTGGLDSAGSNAGGTAPATTLAVAASSATADHGGGAESRTPSSAPDFLASTENRGGEAGATAGSFDETLRSAASARGGAPAAEVPSSLAARTAEGVRSERGLPGAEALLGTLSRGLGDALRAGKREVVVHLTPPNLGQIRIRLDMSNEGRVGAQLAVADPEVHRLLDRNLAELRATLKEHAVDLNDFALLDRREESSGRSDHDEERPAREAIDPVRPAAAIAAGERIWERARAARAARRVDISI